MGSGSKFDSALSTRGGRADFVTRDDILFNYSLAEEILSEMTQEGIKYSKDKIVFAAKLENGNKIFLETGAVDHIFVRHLTQFETAYGIKTANDISSMLSATISKGKLIKSFRHDSNGKEGYRSIYYYKGQYMIVYSIASNGYIETAFPIRYKGGN